MKDLYYYFVFQCSVDLWIIAQAYVFFEKLILKVSSKQTSVQQTIPSFVLDG